MLSQGLASSTCIPFGNSASRDSAVPGFLSGLNLEIGFDEHSGAFCPLVGITSEPIKVFKEESKSSRERSGRGRLVIWGVVGRHGPIEACRAVLG